MTREPHIVPTIASAPHALTMEKQPSDDLLIMETELRNANSDKSSPIECTIEQDDRRNLHSVSSAVQGAGPKLRQARVRPL